MILDFMTLKEIIASTLGLLGSAFALFLAFRAHVSSRIPRLREEYQFAKEFMDELKKEKDMKMHPYLVEKGFLAVTGDPNLSAAEIRYLLSLASPSTAVRRYLVARGNLIFSAVPVKGKRQIDFKPAIQSAWKRWSLKGFYFVGYSFFAGLAFGPLFFAQYLFKDNWQVGLVAIGTFLLSFGWIAITVLQSASKLWRAEELVLQQ